MRDFCYNLVNVFLFCHFFISVAMAVNGLILSPESKLGYEALLVPALIAFLSTLPSFVMYSKKELSVAQVMVSKILQLVLIEIIVLGTLYICGPLKDTVSVIVVGGSVMAVFGIVHLVNWLCCWHDANILNRRLNEIKSREKEN